jgi:hypothetical protein
VTALKELLQQYSGDDHSGISEIVNPKDSSLHLQIPVVESSKAKQ